MDQKTSEMDAKIAAFVEEIKDVKEPNKALITSRFDKGEMELLWKRLEKQRGCQPATVAEALIEHLAAWSHKSAPVVHWRVLELIFKEHVAG